MPRCRATLSVPNNMSGKALLAGFKVYWLYPLQRSKTALFQPMHNLAFFRCFISNSGAHTELQTKPFIQSRRVGCSNAINHDWVQVLSYSKYSLSFTWRWGWSCNLQMISLSSTKLHLTVRLQFWRSGDWDILPILPLLWPGVVEFVRAPSLGKMRLCRNYLSYLPTPPLGQDMTQGQFLSGVLTGLNSELSFS